MWCADTPCDMILATTLQPHKLRTEQHIKMKRAGEIDRDCKGPDGSSLEGNKKNGFFEEKKRRADEPAAVSGHKITPANRNSTVAEVYEQHIRDTESACLDAKKGGDVVSFARLTELLHNLKKHGLDGFMKFQECGSYSFATLKSDDEEVDSEDSSVVSALSSGGGKWINNTASDK